MVFVLKQHFFLSRHSVTYFVVFFFSGLCDRFVIAVMLYSIFLSENTHSICVVNFYYANKIEHLSSVLNIYRSFFYSLTRGILSFPKRKHTGTVSTNRFQLYSINWQIYCFCGTFCFRMSRENFRLGYVFYESLLHSSNANWGKPTTYVQKKWQNMKKRYEQKQIQTASEKLNSWHIRFD